MEPLSGRVRHEELVDEIANCLATSGTYMESFGAGGSQQMVDLHWCAHLAGRRLGIKVRVTVAEPTLIDRSDHFATVLLTVAPRQSQVRVHLP